MLFCHDADLHAREQHRVHTAGEVKLRLYDDNVPVQAKRVAAGKSERQEAPLRPNTQQPGLRPHHHPAAAPLPKRPETSAGVRHRRPL